MPNRDAFFALLTIASAVGSGVIGGVFYAFSTFVMRALGRLPTSEAVAAMNAINVAVINPLFLGVFLGTALLTATVGVDAVLRWDRPGAGYVLTGALLYLLGTFLVTMLFNVPLNDALAGVAGIDPTAPQQWAHYLSRWTLWNHVRTAAAVGSMLAFVLSLRR